MLERLKEKVLVENLLLLFYEIGNVYGENVSTERHCGQILRR